MPSVWQNVTRSARLVHMFEQRRVVHSSEASCPVCGCSDAEVRVRGNAVAAVCVGCRRIEIAPLLDELDTVLACEQLPALAVTLPLSR